MLVLNLPLPPSVNTYWRANGKRRFISKEGMLFREQVADYCAENRVPSFGEKRLHFQVTLYPRDKRLLDIDNAVKGIFDSLKGILFDDDKQIWKFSIEVFKNIIPEVSQVPAFVGGYKNSFTFVFEYNLWISCRLKEPV